MASPPTLGLVPLMMTPSQLKKIPSIELQLHRWITLVEDGKIADCVYLDKAGTQIWIKRAHQNLAGFGDDVPVLTLGNISVNRKLRGKGWFTGFLDLCDALIPWSALYVERVQNPRLPGFLKRQGFVELQYDNFYRPSLGWRTKHGWSPEDISAAQSAAEQAHVRPFYEDPEAMAKLTAKWNLREQ